MKKILIFLFSFSLLFAADFIDIDLDGVPDNIDKCPNTPFSALVDKDGCPIKYLSIPQTTIQYDFYTETSLLDNNGDTTLSQLLYFSLYKKGYYISISTSLNDLENKRDLSDVTVKLKKYIDLSSTLYTSFGIGLKIPTKDYGTNKIDIPLYFSLNYSIKNYTLFAGGSYTFINDTSSWHNYSNEKSGYIGMSYDYSNISVSTTYMLLKDRYDDISRSLGFGIFYFPKKSSLYYSLGYIKGLNNNAIDVIYSIGIGKTF